jgi:hypothetical protein
MYRNHKAISVVRMKFGLALGWICIIALLFCLLIILAFKNVHVKNVVLGVLPVLKDFADPSINAAVPIFCIMIVFFGFIGGYYGAKTLLLKYRGIWALGAIPFGVVLLPILFFKKKTDTTQILELRNLLVDAIKKGNIDEVKELIKNGAPVNKFEGVEQGILFIAVGFQNIEIVSILISAEANVNEKYTSESDIDVTCLHVASRMGLIDIVDILLNNGANVNAKLGGDDDVSSAGATPLHLAAEYDQLVVVRTLLKKGAKIDATDIHGNTPLHYAVFKGRKETMLDLIKQGANVNIKDKYGRTALSFSRRFSSIGLDKTLIKYGAK